jgi:hypothetical protein
MHSSTAVYAADSRRGFRTRPSVGSRRGMRITDENRPWPPLLIHTGSESDPITGRSRLWPPFRINALQASLLAGGFFIYKHKAFILNTFEAMNVWIGMQFYLWVRYFWRGNHGFYLPRLAGVDGWLPIAGLMNSNTSCPRACSGNPPIPACKQVRLEATSKGKPIACGRGTPGR